MNEEEEEKRRKKQLWFDRAVLLQINPKRGLKEGRLSVLTDQGDHLIFHPANHMWAHY